MMNQSLYTELASATLEHILNVLEEADEDFELDIDYDGDVLNIETSLGVFIINKHSAAQEIWLASPVSGPSHFFYENDKWISKKGVPLFQQIKNDFSQLMDVDI